MEMVYAATERLAVMTLPRGRNGFIQGPAGAAVAHLGAMRREIAKANTVADKQRNLSATVRGRVHTAHVIVRVGGRDERLAHRSVPPNPTAQPQR